MGSQVGGIEGEEAPKPQTTHQEHQQRSESTVVRKTPKSTRRGFLKKSVIVFGGLMVLKNVAEYFDLLEKAEESIFTAGLPDVAPPVLQRVEIPKVNEYLRPPPLIIREGFGIYKTWREQDSDLPNPFWKKPENYLDYARLMKGIAKTDPRLSLADRLADAVFVNDEPYSAFSTFTQSNIFFATDLIEIDPGSGIMAKAAERFKIIKTNQDYDIYAAATSKSFTKEDEKLFEQEINHLITDAILFIKDRGEGKSVSTSLLFAYFLHRNQGDIKQSMWDTTIVLKLSARNNIQTLSFEPSREGIEQLSALFIDEFSQQIPLDWLVAHVPANDDQLNDIDMALNSQYKNYQPPNKAGIFYHAWNIMALTTCMSPELIRTSIRSRFSAVLFGGDDIRLEQGSQKIKDDLRIESYSAQIEQVLWQYQRV